MKVLVVGGAGYIGSHCVRELLQSGHTPIVLDNLAFGHRHALEPNVEFYQGDLGDRELLTRIFSDHQVDAVMHFAAFAFVGESVHDPLKYYMNNVEQTIRLLDAMTAAGVHRFVFSSTCATFGVPDELPITEETPQRPINPYGNTKLAIEKMLQDMATAGLMSSVVFRYFNAAGASKDGRIGEDHQPETHLIPLAIEAASGKRGQLKVFGNDYPTKDGTCLRDYVHVEDLSRAHVAGLNKMASTSGYEDYNLGTGKPFSILEVMESVERVSGLPVPYEITERREGDPPVLYADSGKARADLGWVPEYTEIDSIIETAWQWHASQPHGYGIA